MQLPEYVTKEEVKRVCAELGLRDWTQISETVVGDDEAEVILKVVNVNNMDIPLEEFRRGLEIELEHGTMYEDANVTNNHPVLTGKIVLAHLKEMMDYYERLEVAEIEGDLLKAIIAKNIDKVESKYRKLAAAREELARVISDQLY
ncbi:MAG: hypothetical protein PHT28_01435 [Dehalococcoidales bacterium]|jgi:hypothetical protein|nr:hypothetical protein [Dehalococcoidales bacterium]MDD4230332.1 hypothetical protein [Dehalococcoidales bacterium]MDD4465314.1 hypothetical protein [Dehalococcoidales bacterium]MDD5122715.1 hypothetical protein [Dehalococcoidales bacterium]